VTVERYTKVGRGRINGELCWVAIDNNWWKERGISVFSFLVRNKPKPFYVTISDRTGMYSSAENSCLDVLLEQGVIDQDAYRAAIAAHVERML